jgi:ABC-type uncharacterized transport system YnjBCD permease subunit
MNYKTLKAGLGHVIRRIVVVVSVVFVVVLLWWLFEWGYRAWRWGGSNEPTPQGPKSAGKEQPTPRPAALLPGRTIEPVSATPRAGAPTPTPGIGGR